MKLTTLRFLFIFPLLTLLWCGTLSLGTDSNAGAHTAEIATDQPEYIAGSRATILGSSFFPNEAVKVQFFHTDGSPISGGQAEPSTIEANGNGDFLTTWQVCEEDCVGEDLVILATGQESQLAANAVIKVYASVAKSGGTQTTFQGWMNLSNAWGGTLQTNNTTYGDGDVVPLRFSASLAPGSTHTLKIYYEFTEGSTQRFFDSLASFDAKTFGINLLTGVTGLGNAISNKWAFPVDTSLPAGAQLPGSLVGYNISSLSFGGYSLVGNQRVLSLNFTVTNPPGSKVNQTVLLGYGAHLAGEIPWGAGNGASQDSVSSQDSDQFELASASLDNGSLANVLFSSSAVVQQADLGIQKLASPEPVTSGNNISYVLTITNRGADSASSVLVNDPLPAGLTFVSATPSQGTYVNKNSVLSFSLGTVKAGGSATISIVAQVPSSVAGLVTNTASVSAATYDSVVTNNTASVVSTVKDNLPPTIACPANMVVSTDKGKCSAVVTFSTPTATDNVGIASVVCSPPSGSTFAKGPNTVTCVATDTSGNKSSCSFTITVADQEAPQIACPANLVVTNDPGQCSAVVNFAGNVQATDNCPGVTWTSTPPSGFAFPVGTNTVICTATDAAGNSSSCSFTIAVVDGEPPVINCPDYLVFDTDPGLCSATVTFALPHASDNCGGPVSVVCTPSSPTVFPIGSNFVVCTATDSYGNSNTCVFPVFVLDAGNVDWPDALPLPLADNGGVQAASYQQCITDLGQSRWFKFHVQPGSRVVVSLTQLPENYDLVLFGDIGAAYDQISSQSNLTQITASFAADGFNPTQFSPDALSSSAFSPSAFTLSALAAGQFTPTTFSSNGFSPTALATAAFSADAFAASQFAPSRFTPSRFTPSRFTPSQFAPSRFTPSRFTPSRFTPSRFTDFSPTDFSESAFSAAQIQTVLAISAFDGVTPEGVTANTWTSSGDFYVRVIGRNGVYSPGNPFMLSVYQLPGACANVSPVALDGSGQPVVPSTQSAPAGGYQTVILTDINRWLGSGPSQAKNNVVSELAALAARPEVAGVVVDVGADPSVAFFNAQADANYGCPFAKNLVAGAIKAIVDSYRANNALQYVVIVGDDSVIPFFRYPDQAMLGPESNYVPPVKDATASQASLRLGYVLNQDYYGAQCTLGLQTIQLPLPDLAVGRLTSTSDEVIGMVDAYLNGTTGGAVPNPTTSLVTGYDFLADDAAAVENEFALGLGTTPDALISPNNLAPSLCWTADDLRRHLFGGRHDLVFLAGHFSANDALAADFSTHVLATELAASSTDFRNTIIFSAGCHSGYNIVANDGIPFVTVEPDWVRACAQKQATLIAGTGYQYGDTDFIEYSERLYLEFAQQLRTGAGAVSIGKALNNAKRVYLAATPQMRGIHTKSYLEATLFGLPMLSVNLPGQRRAPDVITPAGAVLQSFTTDPGKTLALSSADVSVVPNLTPTYVTLGSADSGAPVTATYLSGGDGIINNPSEPVLPLEVRSVGVDGTVLRGVGFRGGFYSDLTGQVPLTGTPATEIRGVHAPFNTPVFFPIQPWSVNYFGDVCGGVDGTTRLMAIAGQFISDAPGAATGTIRQFNEMDFRLFYSSDFTTYVDPSGNAGTPAFSAPPSICAIQGLTSTDGSGVSFSVRVVGSPAAGIQTVWVTYTAVSSPLYGSWQSFDLVQNATDSTLWQGTLPLNGTPSHDIRYMVQAANGVGLVAIDTKLGAYHVPDDFDTSNTAQLLSTTVNLIADSASGVYGTSVGVTAQLKTAGGSALGGQTIAFSLGDQVLYATTDSSGTGTARATLPLHSQPGNYDIKATFRGAAGLAPSFASTPFTLNKQSTALDLKPLLVYVKPSVDTKIVATLTDGAGNFLLQRTVIFVVSDSTGNPVLAVPVITDTSGRAPLGPVSLNGGTYNVAAYFNGTIPLPGQTSTTLDDGRYLPSTTAGILTVTLVVDDTPPVVTCPATITQSTDPGQCTAVVNFSATVTDNNPGVTVAYSPQPGSVFQKGSTTVNCVATDSAGNTASCSFTVTVNDNENPTISCPGNKVASTDPGNCSAVVIGIAPSAMSDNCGIKSITYALSGATVGNGINDASGTAFNSGVTKVTYTITDTSGNTATCSFSVTVNDIELPKVGCPANKVVSTDLGKCTAVVTGIGPATASDNCGIKSVTYTLSGATTGSGNNDASGRVFNSGVTMVGYTITDTSGNTATCSFSVTVNDTELPKIGCPANKVVSTDAGKCTAVVTGIGPTTASDNCGIKSVTYALTGATTGSGINDASGAAFNKGMTLVTYTVTDTSGNTGNCAFTVTVNDTQKPVITVPANITQSTDPGLSTAVVKFTATALDNCDGQISPVCTPASGSAFKIGTTTVTCVATDAAGNQTTGNFAVTVKDTEPPVIKSISASPNKLTSTEQVLPVKVAVVATDNSGGPVTSQIISVSSSEVDQDAEKGTVDWAITGPLALKLEAEANRKGPGRTYTITVKCTDVAGNSSTGTTGVFVSPPP